MLSHLKIYLFKLFSTFQPLLPDVHAILGTFEIPVSCRIKVLFYHPFISNKHNYNIDFNNNVHCLDINLLDKCLRFSRNISEYLYIRPFCSSLISVSDLPLHSDNFTVYNAHKNKLHYCKNDKLLGTINF